MDWLICWDLVVSYPEHRIDEHKIYKTSVINLHTSKSVVEILKHEIT